MIKINIPGDKNLEIKNLVFDFNGTLAKDGILIDGVKEKIKELSYKSVDIYILTSDTYGTVKEQCKELPIKIEIFDKDNAAEDKKRIVDKLGKENTIVIGNGRNDVEMFKNSRLAIAVLGKEGCYTKALVYADIVVNDIIDAMDLLLNPNRLKATLRT
ncbi:hypothetical protein TKV_c23310 [Thermoanaerobacter kivui]|uniref:Soluble P-type ATPase n=1 Tax=Thermoanaerobacter kivui TaxID=2325 RepID=A0A097AUE7_THEKI|nr:HAD family hydrolase [Thermoanaerobacter kivui]AIS53457.1 hypothetical protein TKV_c23310 [Thermoanaerobacter kivui]